VRAAPDGLLLSVISRQIRLVLTGSLAGGSPLAIEERGDPPVSIARLGRASARRRISEVIAGAGLGTALWTLTAH
jgi:hypothetical protein